MSHSCDDIVACGRHVPRDLSSPPTRPKLLGSRARWRQPRSYSGHPPPFPLPCRQYNSLSNKCLIECSVGTALSSGWTFSQFVPTPTRLEASGCWLLDRFKEASVTCITAHTSTAPVGYNTYNTTSGEVRNVTVDSERCLPVDREYGITYPTSGLTCTS